jgi:hypothetical protein
MRGQSPDLKAAAGRFFYPLGVPFGWTGCALGVNAPFQMDQDRSSILDPATSEWNQ